MVNTLFAGLTTYELKHLTFHLEQSGQPLKMSRLLNLETAGRLNAWFELKDQEDNIDEYLTDINRYWQLNEKALLAAGSDAADDPVCGFIYCLLANSSVLNVVSNVPPNLLAQLVKKELWSARKAIKYALQVRDPKERRSAIIALMPLLDTHQLEAIYDNINTRESGTFRLELLVMIFPNLPGHLQNAIIDECFAIHDDSERSRAVEVLCDHIPENLTDRFWEQLKQLPDHFYYTKEVLLRKLIPKITTTKQTEEALLRIGDIMDEVLFSELVQLIAPKLTADKVREYMVRYDIFLRDKKLSQKVRVGFLKQLASLGAFDEALKMAAKLTEDDIRYEALSYILIRLAQKGKLSICLRKITGIRNQKVLADTLVAIIPYLKNTQTERALNIATLIRSEYYTTKVLLILATRLSPGRARTIVKNVRKSMQDIRYIPHDTAAPFTLYTDHAANVIALGEIVPRIAALGYRSVAMQILDDIIANRARHCDHKETEHVYIFIGNIICEVSGLLPRSFAGRLLQLSGKLMGVKAQGVALTGLAPFLSNALLEETWKNAKDIEIVEALIPYVSDELKYYFIDKILPGYYDDYRPTLINCIAPHLSVSLAGEALKATRLMLDYYAVARNLAGLACIAPATLQRDTFHFALGLIDNMQKLADGAKQTLLDKIGGYLSLEMITKAIEKVKRFHFNSLRESAMVTLLSFMAQKKWVNEALVIIDELNDEEIRYDFLCKSIAHFPVEMQIAVLEEVSDYTDSKKEELVQGFSGIDKTVFPALLTCMASIHNHELKGAAILSVAPHSRGELAVEMMQLAQTIAPPFMRIRAQAAIAATNPHLTTPSWVNESLAIIEHPAQSRHFETETDPETESDRTKAIIALGALLTQEQLSSLLMKVLPAVRSQYLRDIVSGLARFMSPPVLAKATNIVNSMDSYDRDAASCDLLAQYANLGYYEQVYSGLYRISSQWLIVKFIMQLNRQAVLNMLPEILQWVSWLSDRDEKHKSGALCFIIPHLNDPALIKQVIPVLRKIDNKFNREKPLEMLCEQIPDVGREELMAIWRELFPWPNKAGRADLLFDLAATRQLQARLLREYSIEKVIHYVQVTAAWWR